MAERRYYREGWCWPLRTRKRHYFREGRSLCGKWDAIVEMPMDTSGDNLCKECARRSKKLKGAA